MVIIVVYSHVYGGWHAASPAMCPAPHSQVHGTPCRRYGCPGRKYSPCPNLPYQYPTTASGAIPRSAFGGESSGAVPGKWAVPASAWRPRRHCIPSASCHADSWYVPPCTGKRCFPSAHHDRMSEGGSKGCKRRVILGFVQLLAAVDVYLHGYVGFKLSL